MISPTPLNPTDLPTREPKANRIGVVIRTSLSPAEAMRHTVEVPLPNMFDRWLIFPGVTNVKTEQGTWPEISASRWITQTNGHRMRESVVHFEPGENYTYLLSEWTESWDTIWDLVEDNWIFEPDGNGGTIVHWTWFVHVVKMKPLFNLLVKPLWHINMRRMLTRVLQDAVQGA